MRTVELLRERSSAVARAAGPSRAGQARRLVVWALLLAAALTWADAPEDPIQALAGFPIWLAHAAAGLALAAVGTRWIAGRAPDGAPDWLRIATGGALGAVLFTPLALGLEAVADRAGLMTSDDAWLTATRAAGLPTALLAELIALAPPFILFWLVVNTPGLLSTPDPASVAPPEPARTPAPSLEPTTPPNDGPTGVRAPAGSRSGGGLLERLPRALGQELVALKSDVNYLHVFTRDGHVMLLYSLARACEELGDRGLRVHRSFWVARDAVTRVRRTRDGMSCTLCNGMDVPVSRRRRGAVIEEFGPDFRRPPASSA